ncbi:FxsA family protein [Nostocoides vanveenii]|jgi:UPF0716 protein FxsA|uniref:Exlusion protein FxsA n=1 Tax=Nostocoides vanveenii TaxID=330835 RepID=A0ABP4WLZ4_9MICO
MARPVGATPYAAAPRRRGRRSWLVLLFLLVPILEVLALIGVGKVIGGWPTFFLLVFESLLGAWLIRHEGARTWRALQVAMTTGAMPAKELADAALVLVGGTLLLFPGFLTDIVGFFFILPVTRPVTRRLLERAVRSRLMTGFPGASSGPAPDGRRPAGSETVEGQVVDPLD